MKKLTILALALMATSAGMAQSQPVDYVSTLVGTQSTFQLSTGNTLFLTYKWAAMLCSPYYINLTISYSQNYLDIKSGFNLQYHSI